MDTKYNLTGQVFHRLKVLCLAGKVGRWRYYHCRCSCGGMVRVRRDSLLSGNTKSCGCLHREHFKTRQGGLKYKGKTQSLRKWAAELGIAFRTLDKRLYSMHWTVERAFGTPVQVKGFGGHSGDRWEDLKFR